MLESLSRTWSPAPDPPKIQTTHQFRSQLLGDNLLITTIHADEPHVGLLKTLLQTEINVCPRRCFPVVFLHAQRGCVHVPRVSEDSEEAACVDKMPITREAWRWWCCWCTNLCGNAQCAAERGADTQGGLPASYSAEAYRRVQMLHPELRFPQHCSVLATPH